MCGLVGMAGRITESHKKVFKELLIVDSLRGPHSTGVCVADRLGNSGFVKKVGNPYELFDTKLFDTAMVGTKSVLLGHNRFATKGAINSTNAHPFEFGKITGAHNGTLRQQSLLDDWTNFDVDSENLYYHLERHGVQATTPKLSGAYALTWYDSSDESINFLRNDERPLTFCYSKDHKTLYWASEGWMLMATLHRNNLDHGEIFSLPVNKHFKFIVPGGFVNAEKVFEPPIIEETTPYKSVVITYPNNQGKYQSASGSAITKPAGNLATLTNEQKTSLWQLHRPYLGVDCKFVVFNEAKTSTGEYYLHCVHHEDESIELRVFTPRGGPLWEKMINSCHGFQGHTKRYSPEEGGYLLVDIRSIIELPDLFLDEIGNEDDGSGLENDVLEDSTQVYGGRIVDREKYEDLVKHGCAWCGDMTDWADRNDIEWVQADEHVCGQCKHDSMVKHHFGVFK